MAEAVYHVMPSLIQKQAMMRDKKKRTTRIPRGMSSHPLYNTWSGMLFRCYKPKSPNYYLYGAMGVKVCKRWRKRGKGFLNFIEDVGPRPPKTSIDRYPDPWGNYEPGNVRWATAQQQVENCRIK